MKLYLFISFALLALTPNFSAQEDNRWPLPEVSPCPRLFTYEGRSPQIDRWYGIITLLSDSNLTGIWLRIVFSKPIIQLGNWFGEVVKRGPVDYLIKNPAFNLSAHTTKIVRIFVRFNIEEPPPHLEQFRLNGRTVCPEYLDTTTTTTTTEKLFTSMEEEHVGAVAMDALPSTSTMGTLFIAGNKEFLSTATTTEKETPAQVLNEDLDSICGTTAKINWQEAEASQVAHKGQFPWHAALYYTKGVTIVYLCGASLISKFYLITVAHCVIKHKTQSTINPELVIVYLGKFYVKHWAHEPTQTLYVSDIIPHPEFNSETYGDDVALIKLQYPADFTDVVRPICLWQESQNISSIYNRAGTVVGWGFDEFGKIEDALMYVRMTLREQEVCNASLANYLSQHSMQNVYCANFAADTMKCVGDSGGGMVYRGVDSEGVKPVWQLRGLVTYSVVLQQHLKCDPDHYVIFTDVAKYVEWIKEIIKV